MTALSATHPDTPIEHTSGLLEGTARHVSADGCQLVVTGAAPLAGQRLSFSLGPDGDITGTIRWAVGSQAGFAFDRRIDPATMSQLTTHLAQFRTLELLPIAS